MKIHVVFGQRLDGVMWSRKEASWGELVLGPMEMLSFLEGRLGLSGDFVSQPERINQYRLKYENYLEQCHKAENGQKIFGAESFRLDPWSTAKQLLAWRDELIEGLWTPASTSGGGRRIETLAALEKLPPELGVGLADRLRRVLAILEKGNVPTNLQLDITIHEPLTLFPMIWQRILTCLELQPHCTLYKPVRTEDDNDNERSIVSDCAKLNIISLEGNDELELAQAAVRYLAANGEGKS